MLRDFLAPTRKHPRTRRHRFAPDIAPLEGRALLSTIPLHHHVLHHKVRHHAHPGAMSSAAGVTTGSFNFTPLPPGQFGPGTPYPFPGIRVGPGGPLVLSSSPAPTSAAADPAPASGTSPINITPLNPGQYGPGKPYPFAGIRIGPGGPLVLS